MHLVHPAAPLSEPDLRTLAGLREELQTIRLGGRPALSWFTSTLAKELGVRAAASYGVKQGAQGPEIDFCYAAGALPADTAERVQGIWSRRDYVWVYDPIRPDAEQRNRVVTAPQLLEGPLRDRAERAMAQHREAGIDLRNQARALICDGGSLLAAVALYPFGDDPRAAHWLSELVGPLQQRLRLERQLLNAAVLETSLTASLEQLGAPAFIAGPRGVELANTAGRALLQFDPGIRDSIRNVSQGIGHEGGFQVHPLAVPGLARYSLVMRRVATDDPAPRTAVLANRWRLTPRQAEVLALLARGLSNRTIADELHCVERTVEQHVHSIFDKAGVESRAALVARFWTAAP